MRYVITGGSGYIGSRLVEKLVQDDETERVVITDIRPPRVPWPKAEYLQMDVRDPGMAGLLEREKPDALVHLAFVLNPMRDEPCMYDIDVNGTQNVLEAAAKAGVGHLLVASSGTAYGAWPDNPIPIREEQSVRAMAGFPYARDKAEIDRMTQLWATQHPDRVTTIVRPSMVFGPTVDNYLIRPWQRFPFFPLMNGSDVPVQFVHEEDLAPALVALLAQRKGGAFNVGGDGTLTWTECAAMAGLKVRRISHATMSKLVGTMWRLRVPTVDAPPGHLDFIRYPWVVANDKLKREVGWQPRYDNRETFAAALRARGIAS